MKVFPHHPRKRLLPGLVGVASTCSLVALHSMALASTRAATDSTEPDALPYHSVCPPAGFENKLVIHQMYVGQGDSALIRTPSGTLILVDGGEMPNYEKVILPTLKNCYKTTTLDYIVLTHPHSDHFGGIYDLVNDEKHQVSFKTFITGSEETEKGEACPDFHKVIDVAKTLGTEVIGPKLDDTAIVDSPTADPAHRVDFNVIVSNGEVAGKGMVAAAHDVDNGQQVAADDNSISVGMIVSFGNFKFFTAGDLTGGETATNEKHPDIESTVAEIVGPVDVYKASHHGSDTSNKMPILSALKPTNVLVSVGAGGKNAVTFKLPRKLAISALQSLPSVQNIFMTSSGVSQDIPDMSVYNKVHNLGVQDASGIGSDLVVVTDEAGENYTIYGYSSTAPNHLFASAQFKTSSKAGTQVAPPSQKPVPAPKKPKSVAKSKT